MTIKVIYPVDPLWFDARRHRIKVFVEFNSTSPCGEIDTSPLATKIRHGVIQIQGLACETGDEAERYSEDVLRRITRADPGCRIHFGLVDNKDNRRLLREFVTGHPA